MFEPKLSLLFALTTLLFLGIADFVRKKAVSSGAASASYLLVESLFLTAFALTMTLILEKQITFSRPLLLYAPISGLFIALAIGSLLYGLSIGEASTVVPIGRLGLFLTSILAILFLNETLTTQKLLGTGFAVLAVILLSR